MFYTSVFDCQNSTDFFKMADINEILFSSDSNLCYNNNINIVYNDTDDVVTNRR